MRIINYFREVQAELAKVIWPTREQIIRLTILVIVVAGAAALILGGLDYLLTISTNYLITTFVK